MTKGLELIEKAVLRRSVRRNLAAGISRYLYANELLFRHVPSGNRKSALYVGIGNGLDALLALLNNDVDEIVGVDPYRDQDGSDEQDLSELLALRKSLGLENRLAIEKTSIEEFQDGNQRIFDLIVCRDVLHHIFVTDAPLTRSIHFDRAATLFASLLRAGSSDGMLVVDEVERLGLKQLLTKCGMLNVNVRYETKQSWKQWAAAATKAGWSVQTVINRVPYPFRSQKWVWSGFMGRYTVCDRYGIYFRASPADSDAFAGPSA